MKINARQRTKQLGHWFGAGTHGLAIQGRGQQQTPEEVRGVRIGEQVRGRGDDEHRSFPVKRPGAGTRSELPSEFWRIMAGRESGLWAATRPQALIGYRHCLENQKESRATRESQIQAHKPGKLAGQSGTQTRWYWWDCPVMGRHSLLVGAKSETKARQVVWTATRC